MKLGVARCANETCKAIISRCRCHQPQGIIVANQPQDEAPNGKPDKIHISLRGHEDIIRKIDLLNLEARQRRDAYDEWIDKQIVEAQTKLPAGATDDEQYPVPPKGSTSLPEQEGITQEDQPVMGDEEFNLSSINVTSVEANKRIITDIEGLTCIQEHQLPVHRHKGMARFFKSQAKQLHLDPPQAEGVAVSAGTGFAWCQKIMILPLQPNTSALKKIAAQGRISICLAIISTRLSMVVYNPYCPSGGHTDHLAAARTDAIFAAIREDHRERGCPPSAIACDLNAETRDIPTLTKLLAVGGWVDVGAIASRWGGNDAQHTCLAPNAKTKTRRDYIFLTANLVTAVTKHRVFDDGTFAVHARVQVTFTTKAEPYRTLTFAQVPPVVAPPAALGISRKEWVKELSKHQIMKLDEVRHQLEHLQRIRNTKEMWKMIFGVFEYGMLTASDLCDTPGQRGRGLVRYKCEWTTPRLNATQQTPIANPEQLEKAKYLAALAEMSYTDLTKYRRTKWVCDNIRAAGAPGRMEDIKLRASAIYFDYPKDFHRPHLEQFLTGKISMYHFATILKGQLIALEQRTRKFQC